MDPLLLEALRFGTAILAGGIVAVIAQRLAFGHARSLQRAENDGRDRALRVALRAEIDENLLRIATLEQRAPSPLERSAWDAARALPWTKAAFALLAMAYALAADLNARIAIADHALAVMPGLPPTSDAYRQAAGHHKALQEEAQAQGVVATLGC